MCNADDDMAALVSMGFENDDETVSPGPIVEWLWDLIREHYREATT